MKRVYLEITDACNLNCPFCSYPKGNTFMEYADIEHHVRQIRPFCSYLYLHMLGEPLLHPDFERILDLLDKENMDLQLVTNGLLLNRYPDLLKHRCLRKLSVSLHSINHVPVSEDYFRTIDGLIENDQDRNIELRFYGKQQLDERLQAYLQHLEDACGFTETSKKGSYNLKNHVYVYFSDFFEWPQIDAPSVSDEGTCHGATDMIAINVHHDVTLCCLDPKAYNKIGNLKEKDLSKILSSKTYLNYLADFRRHYFSSELCQRCSYRTRFNS